MEENQSLFQRTKEIATELRNNADNSNAEMYYKMLDELTGIFCHINVAFKSVRAQKENEEVGYYYNLKVTASHNNEKFVDAVAKQEASFYIAPLRTVRDILEGYVESVSTCIGTCKARIYEAKKDRQNEQGV